jgi:[ribosomal protein S5]-alanine N-acetyltransferase
MPDESLPVVTFTALDAAHAADLHALWSDAEGVRYTNWDPASTAEDTRQRIARLQARYADGAGRLGPWVVLDGSGQFVGLIGVDFVDREYEVWYLVRRSHWGRGYGSAMLGELLVQASAPRYARLVATAVADNTASWRLLERHGFRRVATLVHGFRRHGVAADLHRYERVGAGTAAATAARAG